MNIFLFVFFPLILLGCVWSMINSTRTLRQRKLLIYWAYESNKANLNEIVQLPDDEYEAWRAKYKARREELEATTFDQHYWALMTFRDPMKFYPLYKAHHEALRSSDPSKLAV